MCIYARARFVTAHQMAPGRCEWTATACNVGCPFFCSGCTFAQADKPVMLDGAKWIVARDWYLTTVKEIDGQERI